jgi:hypothetical protein
MRFHDIVRILFYSIAAIALVAVAILGMSIYRNGIHVPQFVINAPVVRSIASRYGFRYKLDSLQIGCLGRNCSGEVNVGALDFEIQIPEPLHVHLNQTHSSRGILSSEADWRFALELVRRGLQSMTFWRTCPPIAW